MAQNGSGETSNDTRGEGNAKLGDFRQVGLLLGRHAVVDELCGALVDGELADGVRDLLEEDRDETGVQRADALGAEDLEKARDEAVGILRLEF